MIRKSSLSLEILLNQIIDIIKNLEELDTTENDLDKIKHKAKCLDAGLNEIYRKIIRFQDS